jgi:hypothetical protein
MASNIDRMCTGNLDYLQSSIEKNLPPVIIEIGPAWSLTWGPVVWQAPGSQCPDNTWYVANNKSMTFEDGKTYNTYVVAIAGTVGNEFKDDFRKEDCAVGNVVDFPAWVSEGITNPPKVVSQVVASGTYVAKGTTDAAFQLINTPAPTQAGNGQTLYQYLTALPQVGSTRVIFTGHSLGGALSPTIALAFLQAGQLSGLDVLAYPTAGPTPGNAMFAALFQKSFQKTPATGTGHKVWNCNIVNSLDVVPCAWNNLSKLSSIYGSLTGLCAVRVALTIGVLEAFRYPDLLPYYPIQSSTFQSTTPPSPPKSYNAYMIDAHQQHVQEYFNQFHLHPTSSCTGGGEMTGDDVLRRYTVLGDLVLDQARLKAVEGAET